MMWACDYSHGDNHQSSDLHGFWCHSVAEDPLESALHQYLATKK